MRGLVIRRKQKRPGVTIFQDEACYAENGDAARRACEYALATCPPESREYWITSTPTTSDAWPMKYFDYGQQGEPDFWSLRWPSELNKYVDRSWLASKRRTALPREVATEINGVPADDTQALFAPLIPRIVHPYLPPAPPQRDRVCTIGIDLYLLFSRGQDYSVAVLLGQGADPVIGDSIVVCDLWRERTYMDSELLYVLERWCSDHNVQKMVVESFASTGIMEGCLKRGLPIEMIPPGPQNQAAAFTRLYTLAKENRRVIPVGAQPLIDELSILRHFISETGIPRFSAPSGRHDDTVFALAWATHALASVAPMELRFLGVGAPSRASGMSRAEYHEKQKEENTVKMHAALAAQQAERDKEGQDEQRERAEDFAYRVRRAGVIFPGD